MLPRVYATAEQYETHTGASAPVDIDARLIRASTFLDAQVLRSCWYAVDSNGYPTDAVVAAALASATCAQAEWGFEVGDTTGAFMAGLGNASIGSVGLGRSVTAVSGADAPGRQVAPAVWDALGSPDLTPDRFRMGVVAW